MPNYREMPPDRRPFGASAMTCSEIEASYRDAADKSAQVEILADLNATNAESITDLLLQRGMISGTKEPMRQKQLIELADRGCTASEAAAQLGVTVSTIYSLCSTYKIKLASRKAAPKTKKAAMSAGTPKAADEDRSKPNSPLVLHSTTTVSKPQGRSNVDIAILISREFANLLTDVFGLKFVCTAIYAERNDIQMQFLADSVSAMLTIGPKEDNNENHL